MGNINEIIKNQKETFANRVENKERVFIDKLAEKYKSGSSAYIDELVGEDKSKDRIQNSGSKRNNNRNRTRNVKNNPKKQKQKFSSIGKIGLVALFSAGVLVGHFGPEIPEKYENYKKDAYERALENVKKEIGKDNGNISANEIKVWDKGGQMSSSTDKSDIEVEIGGATYKYKAYIDGTISVQEDTIKNEDIVRAISIVSSAQEGNLIDAIRANHLSEQIEEGKKDYTIEAIQEQNKDKDEDENER